MGEITQVKALELIKDWSLWPRHEANELDSTNVSKLKEVLRSGSKFKDPIIADKVSFRIIDGFHRHQATLLFYGNDAIVDVEFREYANEIEMFLEAARLNTVHGLPLSPKDKVYVILTARRKKIPLAKIGEILGMTKEKIKQFEEKRTAVTQEGEKIALSAGAMDLAGKKLTKKQETYARTANGMLPIVNARLLLNALRANAFPLTPNEIAILKELMEAIQAAIIESEVVA